MDKALEPVIQLVPMTPYVFAIIHRNRHVQQEKASVPDCRFLLAPW
jgi:hypothetical protein